MIAPQDASLVRVPVPLSTDPSSENRVGWSFTRPLYFNHLTGNAAESPPMVTVHQDDRAAGCASSLASSIFIPRTFESGGGVHGHQPIAEFLYQLTRMLMDPNSEIIEWSADGRIVVHDPPRLELEVLGKYFRHSKFSSFQRQLNYFGFSKLAGKGKMSPCSYVNSELTSDLRSLLSIKRKTNICRSRCNKSRDNTRNKAAPAGEKLLTKSSRDDSDGACTSDDELTTDRFTETCKDNKATRTKQTMKATHRAVATNVKAAGSKGVGPQTMCWQQREREGKEANDANAENRPAEVSESDNSDRSCSGRTTQRKKKRCAGVSSSHHNESSESKSAPPLAFPPEVVVSKKDRPGESTSNVLPSFPTGENLMLPNEPIAAQNWVRRIEPVIAVSNAGGANAVGGPMMMVVPGWIVSNPTPGGGLHTPVMPPFANESVNDRQNGYNRTSSPFGAGVPCGAGNAGNHLNSSSCDVTAAMKASMAFSTRHPSSNNLPDLAALFSAPGQASSSASPAPTDGSGGESGGTGSSSSGRVVSSPSSDVSASSASLSSEYLCFPSDSNLLRLGQNSSMANLMTQDPSLVDLAMLPNNEAVSAPKTLSSSFSFVYPSTASLTGLWTDGFEPTPYEEMKRTT